MAETSPDGRSKKLRLISRSLLVPVLVSLLGAIYSGVKGVPYWSVILWALANTAIVLWSYKSSLSKTLGRLDVSNVYKAALVLFLAAILGAVFVTANLAVYFLVRGITHLGLSPPLLLPASGPH